MKALFYSSVMTVWQSASMRNIRTLKPKQQIVATVAQEVEQSTEQ